MTDEQPKSGTDEHSSADDVFDLQRIQNLIELMKQHDLGEIDLKQGEQRIRLSRSGPQKVVTAAAAPPPAAAPQPASADAGGESQDDPNITYIKSPMVGTFYSRPNPNSESFVKVGDHVDPETTVCIIEAMKVFNEIPAELRGKVIAVLVDDEEPVEFGKPLFKVDTSQ